MGPFVCKNSWQDFLLLGISDSIAVAVPQDLDILVLGNSTLWIGLFWHTKFSNFLDILKTRILSYHLNKLAISKFLRVKAPVNHMVLTIGRNPKNKIPELCQLCFWASLISILLLYIVLYCKAIITIKIFSTNTTFNQWSSIKIMK